jgi:hypothetical protein
MLQALMARIEELIPRNPPERLQGLYREQGQDDNMNAVMYGGMLGPRFAPLLKLPGVSKLPELSQMVTKIMKLLGGCFTVQEMESMERSEQGLQAKADFAGSWCDLIREHMRKVLPTIQAALRERGSRNANAVHNLGSSVFAPLLVAGPPDMKRFPAQMDFAKWFIASKL